MSTRHRIDTTAASATATATASTTSTEVFELFPTPVMRVQRVLSEAEAAALAERLTALPGGANPRSDELAHSRLLTPKDDPQLGRVAAAIGPHIARFGSLMFGEPLRWAIKEMWLNVMRTGGRQSVHNHANSFASGILYLGAEPGDHGEAGADTVFMRGLGGRDFVFANARRGRAPGRFEADQWIGPPPAPGDLLLFPSYLLHEVPVNRGGRRCTLAFNAIPERLDAFGYGISFSN